MLRLDIHICRTLPLIAARAPFSLHIQSEQLTQEYMGYVSYVARRLSPF